MSSTRPGNKPCGWSRRHFLDLSIAASSGLTLNCRRMGERPNIVLIITDDQGYGDLSLTGNSVLQTPHIDSLARDGMRFENFYVCPVCAPTRASLLTGRYYYRTGVVDTYLGRAMMRPSEITIAEMLRDNEYRTGIFGKWHLGDNYPMRPQDQGFETTLVHAGGGIGQPSDPPEGNSYMDPKLYENGKLKQFQGYCTDVYTDGAIEFIEKHHKEPFFCYLATNAPHTPLEVPDEWVSPFRNSDIDDPTARIYAMVKNIDDNVGRLLKKLDELGIANNTVVMFLTDNGPQQPGRYNGNMRGLKTTVYQGGIRVPLLVRWPGKVEPASETRRIAAHLDIVPTICEITGTALPRDRDLDGRSLMPLFQGRSSAWADRTIFTQWHRGDMPNPRQAAAAITERYKLVLNATPSSGVELFDLVADPAETTNLSDKLPQITQELLRRYDRWFERVTPEGGYGPVRIWLGDDHENPSTLTRQDWRGPRAGWGKDDVLGHWEVDVRRNGLYQITVHTKPLPEDVTIQVTLNQAQASALLPAGERRVTLPPMNVQAGEGRVEATYEYDGLTRGVWYVDVERIG
jgi:arylsulfatase A-like enzyme